MQELLRRVQGTQNVLGQRVQRIGRDAFLIHGQVYTLAGASRLFGAGGSRGRRYGNAEPSAPPNRDALAFLSKSAKGIKGTFTIEALSEVLSRIGWSIEPVVLAERIDGDRMTGLIKAFYPNLQPTAGRDFMGGGSSGIQLLPPFENDRAAAQAYADRLQVLETTEKKGPSRPEAGRLYILKPSIKSWDRVNGGSAYTILIPSAWYGMPGWTITTPKGSVSFTNKLSYRGRVIPFSDAAPEKVWTLLYKSGLKEAAQEALSSVGQETVERTLRPTTYRSLKNTGTCPACFANVKLASGKIMRHGWVVSGHRQRGAMNMSWHSGPCFGTAWQPFEVSKEGTMQFLEKIVMPARDRAVDALARLRERPETLILLSSYRGEKNRTVTKGERDYERELGYKIDKTEHELRGIDETVKTLREAINTWKSKSLPT